MLIAFILTFVLLLVFASVLAVMLSMQMMVSVFGLLLTFTKVSYYYQHDN